MISILFIKNDKNRKYNDFLEEIVFFEKIRTNKKIQSIPQSSPHQKYTDVIKAHKVQVAVFCQGIPPHLLFLLRGLGVVTVCLGLDNAIKDDTDIMIDPWHRETKDSFCGERYAPKQTGNNKKAIQGDTALQEISEIINIINILKWDSDYFREKIAYLSCRRLTPAIEKLVKGFCRREKVDLIEYLCNAHDPVSVQTAENNQYRFVDIRMTYQKRIIGKIDFDQKWEIRNAVLEDIPLLKKMAKNLYTDSRYFYDTHFDVSRVRQFYPDWVEKAVKGTFDDFCVIVVEKKEILGYCTLKVRQSIAKIGVVGVNPKYQGKGVGRYLLNHIHNFLIDENCEKLEVTTQGRNYSAQILYQKSGFYTASNELWYHKWVRSL